jgi:hypothetical protein
MDWENLQGGCSGFVVDVFHLEDNETLDASPRQMLQIRHSGPIPII